MQKPMTLDQAVIQGELQEFKKVLEELKRTLEQLADRLTRVETSLGVSETGLTLIYSALEAAGVDCGRGGIHEKPSPLALCPLQQGRIQQVDGSG
jgi:hypothetical protein